MGGTSSFGGAQKGGLGGVSRQTLVLISRLRYLADFLDILGNGRCES